MMELESWQVDVVTAAFVMVILSVAGIALMFAWFISMLTKD